MVVEVPHLKFDKGYTPGLGPFVGTQYGAVGGALGVIADGIAKKYDEHKMNKKMLYHDALGWLLVTNFRVEFANQLEKELNTIPWFQSKRCDKESKIKKKQIKQRLKQSNFDSLFFVKANYGFSDDCRCIELFAEYSVFHKSDIDHSYYRSRKEQFNCNELHQEKKLVLLSWVDNNGELIKSEMKKGIKLLAARVKEDIEGKYFQ